MMRSSPQKGIFSFILKPAVAWTCIIVILLIILFSNRTAIFQDSERIPQLGSEWTEKEYVQHFESIASEKGSLYAFELLRNTQMPHGVNIHSVGHGIGRIHYEQQGISGIRDCTEEFRSACAHQIVIGALVDFGLPSLSEVVSACELAKGGPGAKAMCFHGIGHGLLAYLQYDYQKAVEICSTLSPVAHPSASLSYAARFTDPSGECVSGALMELTQGEHDVRLRQSVEKYYLPKDNTFFPCTADFVPDVLRHVCLLSITEHLFSRLDVPDGTKPEDVISEAMEYCALLSGAGERASCYGGFGKQFVFYSTSEYAGNMGAVPNSEYLLIHTRCQIPQDPDGRRSCRRVALDSLFWAGHNDLRSAVSFCSLSKEAEVSECYSDLKALGKYFLDVEDYVRLCSLFPPQFRKSCEV